MILVSYRRADLLEAALDSVAERLPDSTVRVWDNHSEGSDAVRELARRWPVVDWSFCDENLGFAAAVNALMRRVSAPTAFLLNPDAVMLGDLARCRALLANDPGVAAAAPNLVEEGHHEWDNAHREPTWLRHLVSYSGYEDRLGRFAPLSLSYRDRPRDVEGYLTGAGLLISMDAWRAVGEFDERYYLYGEEADWCFRARRRGLRLVSVDEPGIAHTAAGTVSDEKRGLSRSEILLAQSRVRYITDQQGAVAAGAYRVGASVLDRVQRSKRELRRNAESAPAAGASELYSFVITTPTLGFGGAERQRVALANGLAAAGERVQLRALQSFGPLADDLDGSVSRRLDPYTRVDRDAGQGTVLVTGTGRIEIAFGAAWRARNLPHGRWVIANHRPAEEDHAVFERWLAAAMLTADGMIYLSQRHRRDHQRHQRLDTGRWWVVPNGIEMPLAEPDLGRASGAGPLRLVTASRLAEVKQVDLLIRALAGQDGDGFGALDWILDIWGDGPDKARIEASLSSTQRERIQLRGWCADVTGMLAEADVLCLPSRAEAQPMTVLEAMAVGTVVAAHPVAAVPEMLDDGRAGYLVEPQDEQGWRRTLRRIAQDPQDRSARVRHAYERVHDHYSAQSMVRGYLSVRDDVTRGLRRGS